MRITYSRPIGHAAGLRDMQSNGEEYMVETRKIVASICVHRIIHLRRMCMGNRPAPPGEIVIGAEPMKMGLSHFLKKIVAYSGGVVDSCGLAKRVLPKMIYDFYAGGAEDEWTLKENIAAFQRIRLRPRILVDVSHVDLSTTVLGFKISAPIMIAPTAMHKLAHPEGELATAKAAAGAGTIMIVSFSSTSTVEEIAGTCDAVRFFQLYVYKNRNVSAELVRRAERTGYKAIVLTADTPKLGRREADIRNK
eukprot:Gb_37119 [translate_table: standard]